MINHCECEFELGVLFHLVCYTRQRVWSLLTAIKAMACFTHFLDSITLKVQGVTSPVAFTSFKAVL